MSGTDLALTGAHFSVLSFCTTLVFTYVSCALILRLLNNLSFILHFTIIPCWHSYLKIVLFSLFPFACVPCIYVDLVSSCVKVNNCKKFTCSSLVYLSIFKSSVYFVQLSVLCCGLLCGYSVSSILSSGIRKLDCHD